MLLIILYYTILSICIIVIGHVLWDNFCNHVVTPKIKHPPSKKYQEIIQELQTIYPNPPPSSFISEDEKRAMMEELQQLLL